MKVLTGIALGMLLMFGAMKVSAQNDATERALHPRIVRAIEAIEDARNYLREAPPVFGGHRDNAIRACDNAIRELRAALEYREHQDREHR